MFEESNSTWKIHIKDTGIGIKKEDYNLVFKEFKRINSPYVANTPGTGLGLSLTKRLVNIHNGDITFKSKLGKGTTFN
ncbi:MAG: ATP-binding protein [Promethearchaeia archaeon]